MTAIWGLLCHRDQPIDAQELRPLAGPLSRNRLSSTMEIRCLHGIGMGQFSESASSVPPGDSRSAAHSMVFMGRLDNRSDLCRQLQIGNELPGGIPNRQLIKRAYTKWGSDCVEHLLGDWAFALWDNARRRLLLARDACGRATLFYCHDHPRNRLLFSSQLSGIVAMPGLSLRLNPDYFAQHAPGIPRHPATPYLGIERLPPGHVLIAGEGMTNLHPYWDVHAAAEVRLPSQSAYTERFSELFDEAVRCRMDGEAPIGAFLSGGIDSGAVATRAAQELATQGKQLPTFSAVPHYALDGLLPAARTGDETNLIRAVTDYSGNIQTTYLSNAQASILDGIRIFLDLVQEPLFAPGNAYWYFDIMRQARDRGIRTLLCGEGGNMTLSYTGQATERRACLKQQGRWDSLALDACSAGWHKAVNLTAMLGQPAQWGAVATRIRGKQNEPPRSVLNPQFLAEYRSQLPLKDQHQIQPSFASHQASLIAKYLRAGAFTIGWNVAAANGVEVRDPTFDRRVIEFCLGIPRDLYQHRGQNRMLVRRAMAKKMPAEVLWNQRRGLQSADIVHRIRAEHAAINEVLCRLEASPLVCHYLHLSAMRDTFARSTQTADYQATCESSTILLRGLMIGLFLLTFDER